jgi:protein SCO1/2
LNAGSRLGITAGAFAAAALGVAAWLHFGSRAPPIPEVSGHTFATPRALPAVELRDENGAAFRTQSFAGHWSFLYFGYTYCPDVCPLALIELASVKKELATQLPGERVEYYLVSVDPRRDTPDRLREYVAYFDPSFHGLTGSSEAIAMLADATETLYFVPEGQGADNYLVSHSSNVILLNPAGELYAIFTPPHSPTQLAADFGKLAAHYGARR